MRFELHGTAFMDRVFFCGLVLLLALGLARQAAAQEGSAAPTSYSAAIWDYLTVGGSLMIGIGGREADLTVTRQIDKASGKLVQRNERSYFLSYSTRPTFFGGSRYGYDFMFNVSTFNMDRQETAKNVYQNLGTGAHGAFAYVVPTIFRMWGDHRQGTYFKADVGLGVGIARFDGDIILTDSATQDRIAVTHQTSEPLLASSLALEARWRGWGLLFTVAGPNAIKNGVEMQVGDVSWCFGYRHNL